MEKTKKEKNSEEDFIEDDFIELCFLKFKENIKNPSLEKFRKDFKEISKKCKEDWKKSFENVSIPSLIGVLIIIGCLLWGVHTLDNATSVKETNTSNWNPPIVEKVMNTIQPYKTYSSGPFIIHYKNISELELLNLLIYFEGETEGNRNIEFIIDKINNKIYMKAILINDINFIDEWLLLSMLKEVSIEVFEGMEIILKLYMKEFKEENLVKVIRTQ